MHVVNSYVVRITVKLGGTWDTDMFEFLTIICEISMEENCHKEFSYYSGHIAFSSRS